MIGIDIIGGRSPLFELKDNSFSIVRGMTNKREIFYKE